MKKLTIAQIEKAPILKCFYCECYEKPIYYDIPPISSYNSNISTPLYIYSCYKYGKFYWVNPISYIREEEKIDKIVNLLQEIKNNICFV